MPRASCSTHAHLEETEKRVKRQKERDKDREMNYSQRREKEQYIEHRQTAGPYILTTATALQNQT